jgi:serine/threonine-protein kinase HSL1, negative regulator of Swe1 kinase
MDNSTNLNIDISMRPVNFAIEFFTIAEYGRRANLSLARFTQEKGAASSFHKVVNTLEDLLIERRTLVENPKRAQKMANLLQ